MFAFFRRSGQQPLSDAIRVAMQKDGLTPSVSDPSQLRMVEQSGRYSDRKVTYFRVFVPGDTTKNALDVKRYRDLDVFPGLVLRSGHVERDGTVILTRPVAVRPADSTVRMRAGRIVPDFVTPAVNGDPGVAASAPVGEASTAGPTL